MVEGEVWYVNFPLEEDATQFLPRPAIVLNADTNDILAIKVTKTDPRQNDEFDTPIVNWQLAGLNFKSTARVSKTQHINRHQFRHKIGDLHPDDLANLQIVYMNYIKSQ